jgi:E3 ubiquitin-protein ligase ZNF598
MIAEHNIHLCMLCVENKQSFPSEQKTYTQAEYERHLRKGDNDGSEGHPSCEFCRKRFYDKTELFVHLTREHFTCHICEKEGIKFKYYDKYK